jgi:hypothetical protein
VFYNDSFQGKQLENQVSWIKMLLSKSYWKEQQMTKKAMILTGIGILIGAIAGYAYHHYVGCTSGPVTSLKPLNSTLYGSPNGGLLFNMFVKEKLLLFFFSY